MQEAPHRRQATTPPTISYGAEESKFYD